RIARQRPRADRARYCRSATACADHIRVRATVSTAAGSAHRAGRTESRPFRHDHYVGRSGLKGHDVFDALTRAIRKALTTGAAYLPALPGGDDPALTNALNALDAASAAITNAQDLGAWAQAVSSWHQTLEDVAAIAFDRVAAEAPEALAELAARVLMARA